MKQRSAEVTDRMTPRREKVRASERAPSSPPAPGPETANRASVKQEEILDAATRVFLKAGYAAASMDAIARTAGVSKRTIYSHFGSKEALFATIIRRRCDALLGAIATQEIEADGVQAVLASLARQFLDVLLSPTSLALHRVVISEAARLPHLGRVSYRSGPAIAVETLAAYLEEQTRKGTLRVTNPPLAAEQFFGMVLGHTQLRALLGLEAAATKERREGSVETAVSAFLRAYQVRE